jgi:hypothetical protein
MTDIIDNTGKKSEWTPAPQILDGLVDYTEDADGRNITGIVRRQEITDDYLQLNHDIRVEQAAKSHIGDWMPVASIPVEVAQFMLDHLGYDVTREPFKKTVAMLKQHGLDDFVLTRRSL